MRVLKRLLVFASITATVLLLVAGAALVYFYYSFSHDLPDAAEIAKFELALSSRMYAADGSLIGEYARERRLYIPIQMVPKRVINCFLAADDKNFYQHDAIDTSGKARAIVSFLANYGSNRRTQGTSTITQQVAKYFLLTPERGANRAIREALLARRIEASLSKDQILELYLNGIYLGFGTYGIAAASLAYFDKPVSELTVAEAAYLASAPKMPERLHPVRNHDRALERRNRVIDRLVGNGWITEAEAEKARREPLVMASRRNVNGFASEYFVEDVRRDVIARYGEKNLYEGGLSVRTTLDPKIQIIAQEAMRRAAINLDQSRFYRGAISRIDISGDWGGWLAEIRSLSDIAPWRMAVVLETGDQSARIGFRPDSEFGRVSKRRDTGLITLDGVRWARPERTPARISQILKPGDVIYADPLFKDGHPVEGQYRLRQIPHVSGAMVAMDVRTGRVLAMAGGFSFDQSPFNRATQACRQPASSFKPIVYSAVSDDGSTPANVVVNAPIRIPDQGPARWRSDSFSIASFPGELLMLPDSMTQHRLKLHLAQDGAIILPGNDARRLGVTGDLANTLSAALGSGATTAMAMVTATSLSANGGQPITPTMIDYIQDHHGHIIFRPGLRDCRDCDARAGSANQSGPPPVDQTTRAINTMTAYRITKLVDAMVQAGTATMLRDPAAAGSRDAWLIGLAPDIAIVIHLDENHRDAPRMGNMESCGPPGVPVTPNALNAVPINKLGAQLKVPAGITLISVVAGAGMRQSPGTAPAPTSSVIAAPDLLAPPDGHELVPGAVAHPDSGGGGIDQSSDKARRQ